MAFMYAGRESTTSQAKLIRNLHPRVDMPREILILTILTIYYMSLLQWGICHFLLHFFSLMGVIWDLISHLFKYQFECFIIRCEELSEEIPNYLYKYTFSIFILLKTYLKMTIYAIFFLTPLTLEKGLISGECIVMS